MSSSRATADPALIARSNRMVRKRKYARVLTITLILLAVVAGIATYVALTGSSILVGNFSTIISLLAIDVVLIIVLAGIVVARFLGLWWAQKSGLAGARLHIRIVTMFAIMAALPAILLGIASVVFFHLGVQAWFSERVRSAVHASEDIAQAYVEEHRKSIEVDIQAMAYYISRSAPIFNDYPNRLDEELNDQVALRGLSEAMVVTGTGQILGRSTLSFGMDLNGISQDERVRARRNQVVILPTVEDRVRAMVRLDDYQDIYLFVGRFIDPRVVSNVERIHNALAEYNILEHSRNGVQITFAVIYVIVGLLLLFAAVLAGLWLSTRLVEPIARLVSVTERVRQGDMTARVEVEAGNDELSTLGRAFNSMTGQIQAQHGALLDANRQVDERRRFIEAMLAGVSSGVLGVEPSGRIVLSNQAAETFFDRGENNLIGRDIAEIAPEMAPLFETLQRQQDDYVEGQIHMTVQGHLRHVMVRMVSGKEGQANSSYVVTFDDVSELVTAQRTAAWADVARRIAHEIKNPLTPIQLSAERLKRKYLKEISSDPEIFNRCTETIIRQVGDIGRMVDEFSAFARMPTASFEMEDVIEQVKQAVFLRQVAAPEIIYLSRLPEAPLMAAIDRRQISQALTNILKNAAESIEARAVEAQAANAPYEGCIEIKVDSEGRMARIIVIDNGRGLPADRRDRLTEPYVTTRVKGTGLGLAIVRKVMEEHGGTVRLGDAPGETGGAMVELSFPFRDETPGHGELTRKVIHGA